MCLYVCGGGGVPVKGSVLPMDMFKCVHYEKRTVGRRTVGIRPFFDRDAVEAGVERLLLSTATIIDETDSVMDMYGYILKLLDMQLY